MLLYRGFCAVLLITAQVIAPQALQAQTGKQYPEIQRRGQESERQSDGPMKDTDIRAVAEVIDAQRKGEMDRISDAMRNARLDLRSFERRLARVIYALVDASTQRAARHFESSQESSYADPLLAIAIERKDLADLRERLHRLIEGEYQAIGGVDQFRKDQTLVLKHERALAKQIVPLYQLSEPVSKPK
jgi:hypothetical protein